MGGWGRACSLQRCGDYVSGSGEPFWELPPVWQTPLQPYPSGKEGYIPTGVLPCASAQGLSPAWHRGPRTLSPDVVMWEVQAGEAVCVRVWLGAVGVPAFLGPSPIQRGHFSPASDLPVVAGAGASPLKSGLERLPTWSMLSGQGGRHWLTPGAGSILVRNCLPVHVASRPPGAPLPGQISAAPGESRFPRQSPRVWKHVSSGSLKSLKWPSFPELGFAGSLSTQIKSREQGPPSSVGAPCLALCPHCQAPHHRGGCWACPHPEPEHRPGAPGCSRVGQDPAHRLATAVCVCVCVCVRACCPASLHPPCGPPSTLRFKTLPRIVHFGESLGCKSV